MARIRTIKPEFWADEKLAPLSPIDRLVFLGLISQADDQGRLVDNVRLIDGLLFPETSDTSRESLETLARLKRVIRYTTASGQNVLQVAKWEEHQRVDHPSKYCLPGPYDEGSTIKGLTPSSGDPRESLTRTSGDPRASTLDLGPTTNDLRPAQTSKRTTYPEDFEKVWRVHPRGPKKKALVEWKKAIGAHIDQEGLLTALATYRRTEITDRFLGHDLFRWIRDARWEEWQTKPLALNGNGTHEERIPDDYGYGGYKVTRR